MNVFKYITFYRQLGFSPIHFTKSFFITVEENTLVIDIFYTLCMKIVSIEIYITFKNRTKSHR